VIIRQVWRGWIDLDPSSLLTREGEKVAEGRMRGRASENGASISAAMRNEHSIERAKRNRKAPTSAEDRLWSMLRGRRYRDAKFRHQHAIGPYVVDFACVALMLVIEVDGPSHADDEQRAFDRERTALLERSGWRVARIPNEVVFERGDGLYMMLDATLGVDPASS
jgi:very-short-patch-repair endonuclease